MIFHARTYLFTSLDLKCSILRPECDLVLEPNGFLCSTVVWFQCVLWSVGVEETTARNANLNLPYKYFSEANTNPYVHRKPRIFSMNMVCPDIMDLMYVWKSWHFSLMIKIKDVTRYVPRKKFVCVSDKVVGFHLFNFPSRWSLYHQHQHHWPSSNKKTTVLKWLW